MRIFQIYFKFLKRYLTFIGSVIMCRNRLATDCTRTRSRRETSSKVLIVFAIKADNDWITVSTVGSKVMVRVSSGCGVALLFLLPFFFRLRLLFFGLRMTFGTLSFFIIFDSWKRTLVSNNPKKNVFKNRRTHWANVSW